MQMISPLNHVKILILNFAEGVTIDTYDVTNYINCTEAENIYINGNGATVNVRNRDSSYEAHFLVVSPEQYCVINNLNLVGFNMAIHNEGTISAMNLTFNHCKWDSAAWKNEVGAIYNAGGYVYISHSSFEDSYGQNGGAIYNHRGILICDFCNFTSNKADESLDNGEEVKLPLLNFTSNKADESGGAIYNYIGTLSCFGCNFNQNHADDDGGAVYDEKGLAIYNNCHFNNNKADDNGGAICCHYGVMNITSSIFNGNKGDDGDAIYNDFGEASMENCNFTGSKSEKDYVFNYGKDAKNNHDW